MGAATVRARSQLVHPLSWLCGFVCSVPVSRKVSCLSSSRALPDPAPEGSLSRPSTPGTLAHLISVSDPHGHVSTPRPGGLLLEDRDQAWSGSGTSCTEKVLDPCVQRGPARSARLPLSSPGQGRDTNRDPDDWLGVLLPTHSAIFGKSLLSASVSRPVTWALKTTHSSNFQMLLRIKWLRACIISPVTTGGDRSRGQESRAALTGSCVFHQGNPQADRAVLRTTAPGELSSERLAPAAQESGS